MLSERIWALVGDYQHGSQKNFSIVQHTMDIMRHLQISRRGRKRFGTTILFVDFKGAYDNVDRIRLFQYLLEDFKEDKLALSIFAKLLWPSKTYGHVSLILRILLAQIIASGRSNQL